MDQPEHVVVLNDWINQTYINKYVQFVDARGSEDIDSILINGRGVNTGEIKELYKGPRAEFLVTSGFRYRFRIINAGLLFCPLEMSIDEHVLVLIAVDGNPIKPVRLKSIILGAG